MLQKRLRTGEYDWVIGRKDFGILEKLIEEKQEKQREKPELKITGANSYKIPSGRWGVSPYSSRKHIFQKQLLVFRGIDDKKRGGEEGKIH